MLRRNPGLSARDRVLRARPELDQVAGSGGSTGRCRSSSSSPAGSGRSPRTGMPSRLPSFIPSQPGAPWLDFTCFHARCMFGRLTIRAISPVPRTAGLRHVVLTRPGDVGSSQAFVFLGSQLCLRLPSDHPSRVGPCLEPTVGVNIVDGGPPTGDLHPMSSGSCRAYATRSSRPLANANVAQRLCSACLGWRGRWPQRSAVHVPRPTGMSWKLQHGYRMQVSDPGNRSDYDRQRGVHQNQFPADDL